MRYLITALGTLNSTFIANFLKQNPKNFVYGVDIYPAEYIYASCEVDKFQQVSSIYEMNQYFQELLDICKKEKIDYIFPVIDEEVLFLSQNRNVFTQIGTNICCPDYETIEICRNKYKTFEIIKSQVPEVYTKTYKISEFTNQLSCPIFIKPNQGRASIDCKKITDIQELKQDTYQKEDFIVQEFLEGEFYAVDFINSPRDSSFFAVPRKELVRNKNGCGTVVEIIKDEKLVNIVKKIAQTINYKGVGNMEFVKTTNGYRLIEINPRFPAGSEYTSRAGADMINDEIKIISNTSAKCDYEIKYGTIFTRRYETYEVQK